MGAAFWLRRFCVIYTVAFAVIAAVQMLKTGDTLYSLTHAATWAAISAAIFMAARMWQARNGHHCAVCRDTPEMSAGASTSTTPE